jgi:hypothetical protein
MANHHLKNSDCFSTPPLTTAPYFSMPGAAGKAGFDCLITEPSKFSRFIGSYFE